MTAVKACPEAMPKTPTATAMGQFEVIAGGVKSDGDRFLVVAA